MARVVALVPDLMFGSRVQSMLEAAGHEVTLTGAEDEARTEAEFADALVVDLTTDAVDGVMLVDSMRAGGELRGLAGTEAARQDERDERHRVADGERRDAGGYLRVVDRMHRVGQRVRPHARDHHGDGVEEQELEHPDTGERERQRLSTQALQS